MDWGMGGSSSKTIINLVVHLDPVDLAGPVQGVLCLLLEITQVLLLAVVVQEAGGVLVVVLDDGVVVHLLHALLDVPSLFEELEKLSVVVDLGELVPTEPVLKLYELE